MLLNDFYNVKKVSAIDNQWHVSLELMANHSLYDGHFPEHPIVPGVCIMQLIKECVASILEKELQYQYVSSCKFLQALDPTVHTCLELIISINNLEDTKTQLQVEGLCGEICFVKLKANLINK